MDFLDISIVQEWLDPWLVFMADDPSLRMMQGSMIGLCALLIFLVFYTTRDVLLRTQNFIYMFFCILIVALLPVIGFFIYLLIRPSQTIAERDLHVLMNALVDTIGKNTSGAAMPKRPKPKPKPKPKPTPKK